MQIKKITSFILIIYFIFGSAHSGINIGLRICNNQWHDFWKMTVAPEVSYSSKWFLINADGTLGSYRPPDGTEGYILQTRWSFIPMLKINLFKPFYISGGYGFSRTYRREEIMSIIGNYDISSYELNHGEFRSLLGMEIPVFSSINIYFRAGYSFIDKNNQYFSISLGTSFVQPKIKSYLKIVSKPSLPDKKLESELSSNKKVTIIEASDFIISELNAAIEASLINADIKVFSCEKMRESVNEYYQTLAIKSNSNNDAIFSLPSIETLNSREIILLGSKLSKMDAIIETRMRYTYKSYGEEIIVNTAYIRIIQPDSGEVVWAIEYKASNSSFARCKRELSQKIIKALKSTL